MRKRQSMDRWHGIMNNGVVCPWFGLHIGRHDLRVITKISMEGIALPAAFGFHNIKGYTSKEYLRVELIRMLWPVRSCGSENLVMIWLI